MIYKDQNKKEVDRLLSSNNNPAIISFVSPNDQKLISTPVWTYYHEGKFYLFTGKKTAKYRAIIAGKNNFGLVIVKDGTFPIFNEELPYLSISGTAKIVTAQDYSNIAEINIALLKKYNPEGNGEYYVNLVKKLEKDPDSAWLIEITPVKVYYY